jgi:hypothetical protein
LRRRAASIATPATIPTRRPSVPQLAARPAGRRTLPPRRAAASSAYPSRHPQAGTRAGCHPRGAGEGARDPHPPPRRAPSPALGDPTRINSGGGLGVSPRTVSCRPQGRRRSRAEAAPSMRHPEGTRADGHHRPAWAHQQGLVSSPIAAAYPRRGASPRSPHHRLAPHHPTTRGEAPALTSSKPARKHTPGASWLSCSLAAVDSRSTTRPCTFPAKPLISFKALRPQHPVAASSRREPLKPKRPRWAKPTAVRSIVL